MRKQSIVFFSAAILTLFVVKQIYYLPLIHYVISPLWIFPIYYFYFHKAKHYLIASILVFVAFQCWYFFCEPTTRVIPFIGVQALFLGIFFVYGKYLKNKFEKKYKEKREFEDEVKVLDDKHSGRSSSLKRLEGQVASLMNLFELARDIGEYMDFSILAEQLFKRIKNEFVFQKMQLILLERTEKAVTKCNVYEMDQKGTNVCKRVPTENEVHDFSRMEKTREMIRDSAHWCFPVFENGKLEAVFLVDGAGEEELAKFEVLSAYLALLIKKIELYETVRQLSIVDELTQVFVRHHFFERLEEELKRSIRLNHPLSLLMLDIDHFKRYNDDFGHLVGDATLREVADMLKKSLRQVDLVGRFGGEEFIVAMPETSLGAALEVAERIRSSIARHAFVVYNVNAKVTVSQGVTELKGARVGEKMSVGTPKDLAKELMLQADQAMYRAKEEGRNRVCKYIS